nr:hypothetical protein [Methanofollis aquaemaris]
MVPTGVGETSGNGAVTVAAALPFTVLFATVAVITTDPGARAVNEPVPFTVPTDGSLLSQLNMTSGTTAPEGSYAAAENGRTSPTVISVDTGVTVTHEITGCIDVGVVAFPSPPDSGSKGESTVPFMSPLMPETFAPEMFSAPPGTTQSATITKIAKLSNTKE